MTDPRPATAPSMGIVRRIAGSGAQRLAGDRVIPVSIVALLLVASLTAAAPGNASGGPTGQVAGAGTTARIAIGGEGAWTDGLPPDERLAEIDGLAGVDASLPSDGEGPAGPGGELLGPAVIDQAPDGAFLSDGELLKPVAVDTTVADGRDRLRSYRVRAGDTLAGIARRFGVSVKTIWWANKLTSTASLKAGTVLLIPPVNGLVVTVKEGETVADVADRTGASVANIVAFNGLTDPNLKAGDTLIVPGGQGPALPTAKPTPKPAAKAAPRAVARRTPASRRVSPPPRYSGGRFAWPVPGGSISQYFHYGHYAIDIAADYGTPVRAAAGGTVIYAGWKSNGGGYQVWIAHGSNLYTTYNHMSAITVGVGERVGRGEQVGRVGQSGWATGPHCHFEVWRGPIWSSGSRINPMLFF